MTLATHIEHVARRTWAGFAAAAALVAFEIWAFVLALIVWSQGLPQDYDSAATMSAEALAVARLTLVGFLVRPGLFFGSIVFLRRRTSKAALDTGLRIAAIVFLAASVLLGMFNFRTWGGFGW